MNEKKRMILEETKMQRCYIMSIPRNKIVESIQRQQGAGMIKRGRETAEWFGWTKKGASSTGTGFSNKNNDMNSDKT